jgi:two-component system nitrate/nitrite response regulator NarP
VIGWAMPGVDGRGVLRALREKPISARIVVYTGHANQDVPRQVMALGGAGFCWKSEPPSQLLDTVAAVAHGQMVFPYVDVRALHTSPLSGLTARERELLEALSQGSSNAKLAADFKISVQTVKFHLKNVYGKLGTANRAQAAALYVSAID